MRLIGLAAMNEGDAHEDPDPEFEGRYRNRAECLTGEDGKAELRAIFRLSRGPYTAAETTLLPVLPTLVEDLLDIVGRSYDGIDYVVLHDIHETMLDPGESDHSLAAVGVVAQTPRDVAANFYLHTRLAEVDVAVTAQLKAHRVLHNPVKPLRKVRRSEAIREVGGEWPRACWISEQFRSTPRTCGPGPIGS